MVSGAVGVAANCVPHSNHLMVFRGFQIERGIAHGPKVIQQFSVLGNAANRARGKTGVRFRASRR